MEKQNKNSQDERISYYESPVYSIAKELRKRGYEIADSIGVRITEPEEEVIGILKDREPIKKSFLGIKWEKAQPALYVGKLWLNHPKIRARENKSWVLEVYGREYVPEMMNLIEELSSPYGVRVDVKLGSENPREETYYFY